MKSCFTTNYISQLFEATQIQLVSYIYVVFRVILFSTNSTVMGWQSYKCYHPHTYIDNYFFRAIFTVFNFCLQTTAFGFYSIALLMHLNFDQTKFFLPLWLIALSENAKIFLIFCDNFRKPLAHQHRHKHCSCVIVHARSFFEIDCFSIVHFNFSFSCSH